MTNSICIFAALTLGGTAGVATGAPIINGSFEATSTYSSAGSYGSYAYPAGTYDGWTYTNGAGIINAVTATPWFGDKPPQGYDGTQYAFIQGTGSISQTFTTEGSGFLFISWKAAARPIYEAHGAESYNVTLTTSSGLSGYNRDFGIYRVGDFRQISPAPGFRYSSGATFTLAFAGNIPSDKTTFIDDVQISAFALPEPATWLLMIIGFGVVGIRIRRSTGQAARAA